MSVDGTPRIGTWLSSVRVPALVNLAVLLTIVSLCTATFLLERKCYTISFKATSAGSYGNIIILIEDESSISIATKTSTKNISTTVPKRLSGSQICWSHLVAQRVYNAGYGT